MNLKNEQVDLFLDSLMSCADMLQVLEEEHDPLIAREAGRMVDVLIRELVKRRFEKEEIHFLGKLEK